MKVYDKLIENTLALLGKFPARPLSLDEGYPLEKEKAFLFPEDVVLDLGGRELPSPYLIGYTSSSSLVPSDAIYLIGEDLSKLRGEVPFAHVSLLRFESEGEEKDQELYRLLRGIEYQRYKIFPYEAMVRVNTNRLRESLSLSQKALDKGLTFASLGKLFLEAYRKEQRVKAVRQYFITDPSFPYKELEEFARQNEGITVALDSIMKKLAMDCSTCQFKGICDEIEGMREAHKKAEQKR